jgi:mannose-6-phosphate isomerase
VIPYPVKFTPIAQQRIWGGNQLKPWFGEQRDVPIGEYWVLSGHPNGISVVENGAFAGKTLVELTEEYAEAYLGDSLQQRFPLLIKFLEATNDLSVQIHPNDDYAKKVEGDYGKTEAWYVLNCEKGTRIVLGHAFKNREEYEMAVNEKRVQEYLRYQDMEPGQLIFVPSQTLHALLAGTVLIEIQQTSDVTYRVYDWDRTDDQGKGRQLHVEKAGDVMTYQDIELPIGTDHMRRTLVETDSVKHEHLVTSPYFVIEKLSLIENSFPMNLGKSRNPDILVVAEGEGILNTDDGIESIGLQRGDTVLIPSTIRQYEIVTKSGIQLLRTYY